jgi:hypothetical protein
LNVKNIPRTVGARGSGVGNVVHTCKNVWCVNPRHLFLTDRYTPEEVAEKKRLKEAAPKSNYKGRVKKIKTRRGPKGGYKNLGASFWLFMRTFIYWGA